MTKMTLTPRVLDDVLTIEEALEIITPKVKAKQKEYYTEYCQRPEVKAKRKEYNKEYYKRPEIKAKKKEYHKERYQRKKQKHLGGAKK